MRTRLFFEGGEGMKRLARAIADINSFIVDFSFNHDLTEDEIEAIRLLKLARNLILKADAKLAIPVR
jgi:hypothetical protein